MNPLRTLLLSGFRPFGGNSFNPSQAIAEALHGVRLNGELMIRSVILPVSGPAAWSQLSRRIREYQPAWVVAMGVSGRDSISWETTAYNLQDYRIPDNAGLQPMGVPVLKRGAPLYQCAIPWHPGEGEENTQGVPVSLSNDPGRYVCNYLYYRLLHTTRHPRHPASGRSLFLHLPPTIEMAGPGLGHFPVRECAAIQQTVLQLLQRVIKDCPIVQI